jgi:hypothetical protein
MKKQWQLWNATMLPYPEDSNTYAVIGADHY